MSQKVKNFLVCTGIFVFVMGVMLVAAGFMKRSLDTDGAENGIVAEEVNDAAGNDSASDGIELEKEELENSEESENPNIEDDEEQDSGNAQNSIDESSEQEDANLDIEENDSNAQTEAGDSEAGGNEEDENATDIMNNSNVSEDQTDSNGAVKVIAIDAGHQLNGNSDKEPNGPGSSVMKAKVTSGATGVSSKVPEYVLTLEVSLKLKEVLLERGYEVVMIRETHEVDLSNAERAQIANESADLFIRIHANGADDASVSGALTIYPSKDNEYVAYMSEECESLSKAVVDGLCEATGAKNRGAVAMDNMSGINWCSIPVTIVEMGYLSNPQEDELMQQEAYQEKIAKGIADGIDAYVNKQYQ